MRGRALAAAASAAVALVVVAGAGPAPVAAADDPPTCGDGVTTLRGTATPTEQKTYHLVPFRVPPGTARVEVSYAWEPTDDGVIDLGVWDADGTRGPDAFRSWAGSRQGRIDTGTAPLVISPDRNERTVVPGPIGAGTWHVELGYAAVEQPLAWRVEVRCPSGPAAAPLAPDPVDPTAVARDRPGWYAGDFHLHAFHSSPHGPTPEEMVRKATAAGLDIVPVTEYVTPAHWSRLGATQRAHPEVLIWPGREVITYFGHVIVLSETPSTVEYRVGFDGITLRDIQRDATRDGALVDIAHPTIFPPDTFGSACRGCFFQMLDQVDLDRVNMIEVVTEGSVAELGGRPVPNPFVRSAVELWEQLLRDGHRVTAVSGSDDKSGDGYGSTSTMVRADQLSRPAVDAALRRGHAYVRGLGRRSPEMDLRATAPDGTTGIFGDTLVADRADLTIRVTGGAGQVLSIRRNGTEVQRLPLDGADVTRVVSIDRGTDGGALGTFWGAEVLDVTSYPGVEVPTVIANPVFLSNRPAPAPAQPTFTVPPRRSDPTPATGGGDDDGVPAWLLGGAAVVVLAAVGAALLRQRGRSAPDRPDDAHPAD